MDRKEILLKAAYDLLKQADESNFLLDVMSATVHYDNAECDGTCLMEDIASVLNISD